MSRNNHKLSKKYIEENGKIVCEKLNVGGMSRKCKQKKDEDGKFIPNGQKAKKGLNKFISDVSWSKFFELLEYKSELYGNIHAFHFFSALQLFYP